MITIRQSHLEQFRRVIKTEYAKESELIESVKGTPIPPNWKMEVGTAWHSAIEGKKADNWIADVQLGMIERYGKYWFTKAAIDAGRNHVGPGVFEIPGSHLFKVNGRDVLVTGKCDHMHGLLIQDNKAKFSDIDCKDYEPSLQWRLYLLIHEGSAFRYNCYAFKDPDTSGYCELRNIVSFTFWPYIGMAEDCVWWIGEFVDWADGKDLLKHLERA